MSDLQDRKGVRFVYLEARMLDTCSNLSFSNEDILLQSRLKGRYL